MNSAEVNGRTTYLNVTAQDILFLLLMRLCCLTKDLDLL
jgi:hypothetical protein